MVTSPAARVLHGLLDQLERNPDRRRLPSNKLPDREWRAAEWEETERYLKEAVAAGAIQLRYGRRELSHIIERITIVDPPLLYAFLGRVPVTDQASSAVGRLTAALGETVDPCVRKAISGMGEAWARQKTAFGLTQDEVTEAELFLKALNSVLVHDPDGMDMRTFSRRFVGDSKAIERNASRIASVLRQIGKVPDGATPSEVLAAVGIEKFHHPIFIAGPLACQGLRLDAMPYLGIPVDIAVTLEPVSPVASILCIENLASFQRHIGEVRAPEDIVIYTGGFPSRAVITALRHLCRFCPDKVFHWGDIDSFGLHIAHFIARSIPVPLRLHLMTEEIASRHGARSEPARFVVPFCDDSPVIPLARFLSSPRAMTMEQEEIDPLRPPSGRSPSVF